MNSAPNVPAVPALQRLLDARDLRMHFQPIVSVPTARVLGYEALARGPQGSPYASPLPLFCAAREAGQLAPLERLCRERAVESWVATGLSELLFLNVTPEVLIDPAHIGGQTVALLAAHGLSPQQIVIEITEQSPGIEPRLMAEAAQHYQAMGFAIALDDLGDGYAGLRLWSQLNPDYVKLDRHFVSGLDHDRVKRRFVRSIIDIAHSLGSRVVAEGVEREGELQALVELGADFYQGWLFARPSPAPQDQRAELEAQLTALAAARRQSAAATEIRRLCVALPTLGAGTSIAEAAECFSRLPNASALAVVDQRRQPLGLLGRQQLMALLGKRYGFDLHGRQPVETVMQRRALCVEAGEPLEQVSRKVTGRDESMRDEDFIITDAGRYLGIGHVINLLQLFTEQQVQLARQANPLTQLPGNRPIRAALEHYQRQNKPFVACYLDLDHFKPFNDRFGYALGDQMILTLARVLSESVEREDFLGHLGGDDFIMLLDSAAGLHRRLARLQHNFAAESLELLPETERLAGGFEAKDRFDQLRFFPHTRLSITALQVPADAHVDSFGDLWSRFKSAAKRAPHGRVVVRLRGEQRYPQR
ncbi:bifunctional diguanylate cyclase/phosphodiesterase [Salinicola sp. DM10]|uniref:bifunctional diguanylate cyclase/phosphodiesterase n=1 Tax=Salinicola sp. DM10 TaxID=2815721 RepID=UPI001A8D3F0E|nr:bifunctional diguanylate cyclase/phosphodiesterase [Salinicola sp. DM10]MCE3028223.1 EAL and GGDEF domain-containing protein [Salinicola sp. DM10]